MYQVLDLFAGCGGLSSGFDTSLGFEIKLANDIWEPARDTYIFNKPNIPFLLDDIKNITSETLNKYCSNGIDVIIGGPPCQGFSMCGPRDIQDERNKLFYEYARIVEIAKPYIFVMENVKGLLSMKNKEGNFIIDVMHDIFKDIGYDIQYKVLNAKYYNVPQARERVIIVGVRDDLNIKYEYPAHELGEDSFISVSVALEGLDNESSLSGELEVKLDNQYTRSISSTKRIYNHEIPIHKPDVEHRMGFVPHGGNWKDIPEEFRVGGTHSNAYKRLDPKSPSVTIKHAYKSMIIHPKYNRCLSIREVARLQSFDDNFIFKNTKTSQYQQLANAVPPNLSKALAISVKQFLNKLDIDKNDIKEEQLGFF